MLRGPIGKIGVPLRYWSHPFLLKPPFNRKLNNPCRYVSYNMDSLGLVPDVVDKLSTEILEVWLVTIYIIDKGFLLQTRHLYKISIVKLMTPSCQGDPRVCLSLYYDCKSLVVCLYI